MQDTLRGDGAGMEQSIWVNTRGKGWFPLGSCPWKALQLPWTAIGPWSARARAWCLYTGWNLREHRRWLHTIPNVTHSDTKSLGHLHSTVRYGYLTTKKQEEEWKKCLSSLIWRLQSRSSVLYYRPVVCSKTSLPDPGFTSGNDTSWRWLEHSVF